MRWWKHMAFAGLLIALVVVPARAIGAASRYTGGGFDTCAAPSIGQMQAWLSSPYRSIGIYVGGVNRACGDGNLSASWVSTVESMGWSLAPLYVGLQAPCVLQGGLQLINPAAAATEGSESADDAVARAANFGLGPGTPIYFDMEGYGSSPACSQAVETFLSYWTAELHHRGYVSGVYGSSASTIADQADVYLNPAFQRVDDIWYAHWNGCANEEDPAYFPDQYWANHQRLHQYVGNTTETWGGVTLSIDRDYDDGAVAGPGGVALTQTSCNPGTGWSPWSRVYPPVAGISGAPAVASWATGRLDVFVQGGDHLLYHLWSNNSGESFSGWESLGSPPGGLNGSPAAVSWGPDRIDVFGRGADNALWHAWWDGVAWSGWQRLGGTLISAPTVASWGSNRLDVFVVGVNHGIYHLWWNGAWHPYDYLGGYVNQDPGATSWGLGRVDVFVLGANNELYQRWWAGYWSPWVLKVPGVWSSGPSAASPAVGREDVFLESSATGNPMGHVYWAGAWYEDSEGGALSASPGSVGSYRRLDVFVRGTDGYLWHTFLGS
jgi:hypothetical protein